MTHLLLDISYDLSELKETVKRFWEVASPTRLITFSGEMGAGKTTFIHCLCEYLHVEDTVSSPTFALINEYHFTNPGGSDTTICHLDWYRLRDTREAIDAGMEDCIKQAAGGRVYCFVEWPEKAAGLLTAPYLRAEISTVSETRRNMKISLITAG